MLPSDLLDTFEGTIHWRKCPKCRTTLPSHVLIVVDRLVLPPYAASAHQGINQDSKLNLIVIGSPAPSGYSANGMTMETVDVLG